MAATTNQSANTSWTLVTSGQKTVSVSFVGVPVEVAITTTNSAPADTVRGHRIVAEGSTVSMSASEFLWQRRARNVSIGEDAQIVITEGA